MRITNDCLLLLTACVHPNGMIDTQLQDGDVRLKQYLEAIDFYLQYTTFKILVVENTEVDMSSYYTCEIASGRMECLTFNGNDFDKRLGKGYGEGLIIDYAFKHSQFIKDCKYVIKISGRHIVLNTNLIIKLAQKLISKHSDFIICEIDNKSKFARSDFYIASKSFYIDYLLNNLVKVNDSESVWFENMLFQSILKACENGFKFLYLPVSLNQQGQSGTTGIYMKKTRKRSHIKSYLIMILYKFKVLKLLK